MPVESARPIRAGSRSLLAVSPALIVAAALSAVSLVLAVRAPQATRDGDVLLLFDVRLEPTLPTWWSTMLLLTAACALAVAAVVSPPGRARASWAVAAAVALSFSLTELSGLHRRADGVAGQVGAPALLADDWVPAGLVAAVVVAAVVGVTAAWAPPRARASLRAGVALVLACAVAGDVVTRRLGGVAHDVAFHVLELGENVGAALLIAAAVAAVAVTRTADGVLLAAADPGQARSDGGERPVSTRPLWVALVAATLALAALSLGLVQLAPAGLDEWRLYVDMLLETNLATWWSTALLATAALAHVAVAVLWRRAGVRGAALWLVSAAVLALLSIDDHTQLHERSENVGRWLAGDDARIVPGAAAEPGSYPFYWLIPGVVAGLAVTAALGVLAWRAGGRARLLLAAGAAVLLGCALGFEAVQGLFMASGDEGAGFVLTYHVEELGENLAALCFLAAAFAAVSLTRVGGALAVRHVARD